MEKWGKPPRYEQPSFSSTLLDSIYRSMDESDGTCTGTEKEKRTAKPSEKYSYRRDSSGLVSNHHHQKLSVRTKSEPTSRHRSGGWAHSTSSSSDCSSYGGFSSSEAESVRLKPIRTSSRPDPGQYNFPVQSPSNHSSDNKKKSSSSVKNKIKEFRKTNKQQMPASPGARLASFLNAIFAKKGSTTSKGGETAGRGTSGTRGLEAGSACSTASSYTRSCLSKTPSTAKRSVRFCPVSVVVGDNNRPYSDDGGHRKEPQTKKKAEEILRRIERDEEEEDREESDSSSDLFELDDLTVGIGRRFRDELPVYGTTSLGMKKAVSHGFYCPVI